jgi:hypothetical protein
MGYGRDTLSIPDPPLGDNLVRLRPPEEKDLPAIELSTTPM